MTDREILELIATQVGKLTTQVDTLTKDMAEIKPRLTSIENTVIRIENDHGQKLGVLLNGYKQNAERLDKVETKLSEHEEIILKKL